MGVILLCDFANTLTICRNPSSIVLQPDSDTEDDNEEEDNISPETSEIFHILDAEPKKRRKVLEHPLVQIFIQLKWSRIRYLLGFAIAYHVR